MRNLLLRLLFDEEGPTSVEYAVMLALIVMACFASIQLAGTATGDSFTNSNSEIQNAIGS